MKYIVTKPKSEKEQILFKRIDESVSELFQKFSGLKLSETGISDYNQRYLKEYLNNYTFFACFYTQVFIRAIRSLKKPLEESVFVDYGGGSGFFSFLAKTTGFGNVIYNDIYNVSLNDAKILSDKLQIEVDQFILGDIDNLVAELNSCMIKPDVICSFEVIEHIYCLKGWFRTAKQIKSNFTLICSSSANIKNMYITRRLKKEQVIAENIGSKRKWGSKERDAVRPYKEIRKEIIQKNFPEVDAGILNQLSVQTRGFNEEDIVKSVYNYLKSGEEIEAISHPTNTCDPYTGNWTEHLIAQEWLKATLESAGYTGISITPGLYTYSKNPAGAFIKSLLNIIIKINRKIGLRVAPVFILEAVVVNSN